MQKIPKSEIWKPVVGFEGRYSVSNLGNVRSESREMSHNMWGTPYHKKAQIMSLTNDKRGYKVICLRKEGKPKNQRVHVLVATAFIPNPENKETVNHINGLRDDNRVENLEWCTFEENRLHAVSVGLIGKKVINTNTRQIFDTIVDAAKEYGGHETSLSKRLRGVHKNNTPYLFLSEALKQYNQ